MPKRIAVLHGNSTRLEPYEAVVRIAGLDPVRNPASLDDLEGLLLTGGNDVDPALYGEGPGEHTDPPDSERDQRELWMLTDAIRLDLPVLAICRGMQLMNVAHGGTLVQHLGSDLHRNREAADAHRIALDPGSRLAEILGTTDYSVNSRHHQAVARAGTGLRIAARCPSDDVIEAVELPNRSFVVAVQWHPEDRVETHEGDRRLFEAFARAIAENRR